MTFSKLIFFVELIKFFFESYPIKIFKLEREIFTIKTFRNRWATVRLKDFKQQSHKASIV